MPGAGQQTIDPKAYILIAFNLPIVQFKKGTMITVTYDSPLFEDDVSADGFAVRIKSADQRATVKFTLDQASPSNDLLMKQALLDQQTGVGTGTLLFKDLRGNSVAAGANCWIKKFPDAPYGTQNESREWDIRVANLVSFIGGTTPV